MNTATSLLALTATVCPDPSTIMEGQRFHSDSVCNRPGFNAVKRIQRGARLAELLQSNTVINVPNERNAFCPLGDSPSAMKQHSDTENSPVPASTIGLDTVWLVENQASSPIVISYVNENGVPVSALDASITPPQADPHAILQPGQWMSVLTVEGHELTATEIKPDGTTGRILLRHTAGLIPIGAHLQGEIMGCPQIDEPPMHQNKFDPMFDRTPAAVDRPCNTIDVGFRNMAGCPLNAFYVTPSADENVACSESFKFHLGVEQTGLTHFMEDWTSATKYEGTFVGHTYHFRLAHDPTVLAQSITLQPTIVTDCPEEKVSVALGVGGEAEALYSSHSQRNSDQEQSGADLYTAVLGTGGASS